jgi:hypothetical protein
MTYLALADARSGSPKATKVSHIKNWEPTYRGELSGPSDSPRKAEFVVKIKELVA